MANSVTPSNNESYFVVRGLEIQGQSKYIFSNESTAKERAFQQQFERIFLAADSGDLKTCQEIVDDGYKDFQANSYGRFITASGKSLDGISPLKIAQTRKHSAIVAYFQRISGAQSPTPTLHTRTFRTRTTSRLASGTGEVYVLNFPRPTQNRIE